MGKAKSLRHRVSSYVHEGRVADAETGTLVRVAVDVDYTVSNKEAANSLFKLGLVGYRRGDTILTAQCHSCVSTST